MATTIGMVWETTPGERRVALVPDVVARLRDARMEVVIEAGAGEGARFHDGAYANAGAAIAVAGGNRSSFGKVYRISVGRNTAERARFPPQVGIPLRGGGVGPCIGVKVNVHGSRVYT